MNILLFNPLNPEDIHTHNRSPLQELQEAMNTRSINQSLAGLSGGHASEAMVDFTGGIVETFELKGKQPDHLFDILLQVLKKDSLVCAALNQLPGKDVESR